MIGYEKFTDSIDEPAEPEPNKPSEDPPLDYQVNYDKIEVSIEDNSNNSNSNEVLQRASLYFLENNDNFLPSWSEIEATIDADLNLDPSKPPNKGLNQEYILWKLRRIVESFWFRIFTFLLIVIDLIVVVIDLCYDFDTDSFNEYQIVDLIITIWFVLELVLRVVALTPQVFFARWYNCIDFAVVLITFVIVIVAVTGNAWAEKLSILTFLRFVRLFRLIRVCTERKQLETAARQMVSQNKRRYQQDGHDLDLTYVTKRVIATSFPSSGWTAMYRNPIEKVAKFLNEKHPRKYRMYNLCSERSYETHHFLGCTVERFMIDDHNVPTLEDMIRFAQSVKEWLAADPENVIVVHCKGGKGRTGTMICVWLVESGVFTSATDSLDYFGNRRTDTNVSTKFQGVETPSQSRYVGYYEQIMNNGGRLPASRPLTISKIFITGMMYIGQGNGEDFWFNIDQGRGNQVFSAHLGYKRNCNSEYNYEKDILTVSLVNCPRLDGNIRLLFQTDTKNVPKGYEKAPFYFWFNTAFVQDKMLLKREDLDNPHKSKTWHCFRDNFSIELHFDVSV